MARTKKEAGEEFLKSVLALVPEDKRQAVQETLGVGDLVEKLGEKVVEHETKAEAAIAKATQDGAAVGKYKQNLDTWYGQTVAQLKAGEEAKAELAKLKAAPRDPDDPNPAPVVPPGLDAATVTKQMADMVATSERGAVGAIAYFNSLTLEHFQKFGEVLNVGTLISEAEAAGQRVPEFYAAKYAPKFQALADKAAKEHEDGIRKDEREKALKELQGQTGHRAYPVPGTTVEESATLAGLTPGNGKADGDPGFGVKAAVDEFYAKGQSFGS